MPNLLFIMTPGTSLSDWLNNGSFIREMRPYVKYAQSGFRVRIVSFGVEKYNIPNLHTNIDVVSVKRGMLNAHLLPFTCATHFRWADVVKTNQSYLSWIFAFASRVYHKPFLLRCGYVRGEYLETTSGNGFYTRFYKIFEGWAFRVADAVTVPTQELADWVGTNYYVPKSKTSIIPNWVDVSLFAPNVESEKVSNTIISVGRLHKDKRYSLLIDACALVPGSALTLIGEGPERNALAERAKKLNVELHLPGIVSNESLPAFLHRSSVFALTSIREGHPKSVIEALACGMPCVAVRSIGIQNLLTHKHTAILAEASPDSLAAALKMILSDKEISTGLAVRGRNFVVEKFGFDRIFADEFRICTTLATS